MIKNMADNEALDLDQRWTYLIRKGFEFDYTFFKTLAAHTFAYLFPYNSARVFPREMITVLLKIKDFACYPPLGLQLSAEHKAAQLVAHEFCDQIEYGWKQINRKFDRNRFVVFDENDKRYLIDANTFDLYKMF